MSAIHVLHKSVNPPITRMLNNCSLVHTLTNSSKGQSTNGKVDQTVISQESSTGSLSYHPFDQLAARQEDFITQSYKALWLHSTLEPQPQYQFNVKQNDWKQTCLLVISLPCCHGKRHIQPEVFLSH